MAVNRRGQDTASRRVDPRPGPRVEEQVRSGSRLSLMPTVVRSFVILTVLVAVIRLTAKILQR